MPDTVLADITGTGYLFGPPEKAAARLAEEARRIHPEPRVAIACNPDAAVHAARSFPGATVIPRGKEREALGFLPLDYLVPSLAGIDEARSAEILSTLRIAYGQYKVYLLGGEPTTHPQLDALQAFHGEAGCLDLQVVSGWRQQPEQEDQRSQTRSGLREVWEGSETPLQSYQAPAGESRLQIDGPLLAASLIIGMLVSVFQAVTQINEQTLSFVPKILVVAGALAFLGPWMATTLVSYMVGTFNALPQLAR